MNIIKEIELKNFRCHDDFNLKCNENTTLIIGENGSGKTSILEAIYIAFRGKSFKATDKEIIKQGKLFYRVKINSNNMRNIIIRFNGEKKEFEVNNKKSLRLSKKDKYPVVLFEPDNIYLIKSSPARRRDYFDELFKQIDEKYSNSLSRYNKALKQRNDLLKKDYINKDDLFSWNIICANYGVEIANLRNKYIFEINKDLTNIYRDIADNKDECFIDYKGIKCDENLYLKHLNDDFDKDYYLGYTNYGIHRDDYEFIFNNKKADGSASRGEMRCIILALKFIESKILEKETNKKPIILLDDIFSELDEKRQKHLVDNFKDYQIIITSTTIPEEMKVDKKL